MVMASFPTIPKEYLLRRIISKEAMTGNTFFSGLPRRFCRKNNSGSGQKRFLILYFLCGFGAAAAQLGVQALDSSLQFIPTVGASGCLYGVIVAFAMIASTPVVSSVPTGLCSVSLPLP